MGADDWILLTALAAMSLAVRAAGAFLGDRLGEHAAVKTFLEAVPGAVLVALVAPDLLGRGIEGAVGAVPTLGIMLYVRNAAVGMCGGIAATALWRAVV